MQNTLNVDPRQSATLGDNSTGSQGRYVYGIARSGEVLRLGSIGIEDSDVYTIPCEGICAIVHNCPAQPYQSDDQATVGSWVKAHQSVLDVAQERFGTVIPMSFDTIFQSESAISPEQVVKDWLRDNYEPLGNLFQQIEGKDEYAVQVFYEPGVIVAQISEQSEAVRKIKEEIDTKSPGMAYLYRQKLEKVLKCEIEGLADKWFKDFYHRIKNHTDNILVEKTKKGDRDKVMLLNLSCLVKKEKVADLGKELEKINETEGFSVHFSGPWSPYSFVGSAIVSTKEEALNGAKPKHSCHAGRPSG